MNASITPLPELLKLLKIAIPQGANLDNNDFNHRRVASGQSLYRAGDAFENLYFVFSGALKLVHGNDEGHECVIEFPMKSDLIGMDGICEQHYQMEAIALMDSDVIVLPFRSLVALSRDIPAIESYLYSSISRGMVREQAAKGLLSHLTAEARLSRFLLMLSERFEAIGFSSTSYFLRMTRQDIGSYLGLTIETVSRSFTALSSAGLIGVNQRAITLHDKTTLRTLQRLPVSSHQKTPLQVQNALHQLHG